jgi:four helix bundle protein
MPFQSYRELVLWQRSVDLAVDVYRLTRDFPSEERFGMTSQVRRAALSISNNIAEGHGRATRGEFLNALSVASGSTNEVENCLLVSQRLGFVTDVSIQPHLILSGEVSRLMAKFRIQLRNKRG